MTATYRQKTVNRFRQRRGRILAGKLDALSARLGRRVHVLDVGGRSDYWDNVPTAGVSKVTVVNYELDELDRAMPSAIGGLEFEMVQGDARDLKDHADGSADVVHSNSVIEHVGGWSDMAAMASEVRRVGRAGWVQTPAWEFPIEPHFRAPMLHWFSAPLTARLLFMSRHYRALDVASRRHHVERINLLARSEFRALFPDCHVLTERVLFPKSYVAHWGFDAQRGERKAASG